MFKKLLFLGVIILLLPGTILSQTPQLTDENLSIRGVVESPFESVKIAYNAQDSLLYVLTQSGEIFRIDAENGSKTEVQSSSNHGLGNVQGLDIATDGTFYIVGNSRNQENATNTGTIKKGEITGGEWTWSTVAETEPYPLSNTNFDHIMNEIVVGPDDEFLFINSGSRTDHGEIQSADGLYPDLREAAITAKILKVPADSVDLLLENDLEFLKSNGYIFAEGTRNSFGLAFDGEGNLFSSDNAGDRDDPGEFNWLQEGNHYGFPWRIGGNDTPMQFEGYNPEEDPLLTTESSDDFFYDDPDYPTPPEGLTFTEPVLNYGPDGVYYKHAVTGEILNASEQDTAISSFTAHRSALGLVFDADSVLTDSYTGDAFVLAFSGNNDGAFLLRFMEEDPGEDLMHLELTKKGNSYEMTSTIIARGFMSPIDAEIVGDKIYVLEFKTFWLNGSETTRIWEIDFSGTSTGIEEPGDELVDNFKLHQNYPNPFNPSTVISYQLSVNSEVQLEVFDVSGRKVATLVNQKQSAGTHQVTFNAENLSSGVYFYQLKTGSEKAVSATQKMILLK